MTEYERGLHCAHRTACWVSFFRHHSHALVITDQSLGIKQLNPKCQMLLGGAVTNGKLFSGLRYADAKQETIDLVQSMVAARESIAETELEVDDKLLSVECQPMFSQDSFLLTLRDITKQRRNQQLLEQQNHLIRLGATAAGIAHELTSPLSALATEIELLQLSQQQSTQSLDSCLALIHRMQIILRELAGARDNSDLDAQRPCDLDEAIDESMRLLRFHPNFQHVSITRKLPETVPQLKVAERHLVLVLLNLLDNACKACATYGGSQVEIRVTNTEDHGICISVIDDGLGISSNSEFKDGLGIGLSVSRHIMLSYDGKLELYNNGQGTTANVVIPALHCLSPTDHNRGDLQ